VASVSQARRINIDGETEGQRIDNFLHRQLKGVPKTRVYRLLRRGEVRVNGGRIKPGYRLRLGDEVRLPPVRMGEQAPKQPSQQILERLSNAIRYEDDQLLLVNKPSGMAVHAGSGVTYGLVEALRALRPSLHSLDLAHRIDRHTSGIVVLCKGRKALASVHDQFREGSVAKRYVALLRGELPRGEVPVAARLARHTGKGGESFVEVASDGKSSHTVFEAIERLNAWTLTACRPTTGRMHQIRVHAAHAGHAIAGDQRYGDDTVNRRARQSGLRRIFLHAQRVALEHPNGSAVTVEAPLAADLEHVLENLRDDG